LILKYVPSLLDIDYTLYGTGEDPREAARRAATRRRFFYFFVLVLVLCVGVFCSWVVRKWCGTVDKGGWAVRELDQVVTKKIANVRLVWAIIKRYLENWLREEGFYDSDMGGEVAYRGWRGFKERLRKIKKLFRLLFRQLKVVFCKIRGWRKRRVENRDKHSEYGQ